MLTKSLFGALLGLLLAAPAQPQAARKGVAGEYHAIAVVAVLPGNPWDSRVYSLRRSPMVWRYMAGLPAGSEPALIPLDGGVLAVRYQAPEQATAELVTNDLMQTLILETDRRRDMEAGYGSLRVQQAARWRGTYAEGLLAGDGIVWGPAERERTRRQLAAVRASIDAAAKRYGVSAPVTYQPLNDSWLRVSLQTRDASLPSRLLEAAAKGPEQFSGRISLLDIDFVPAHMRAGWYIFNCCRVTQAQ